jgi:RHS repeat-associated protein
MPSHSYKTILLATDQQRSVLNALHPNRPHTIAYTPYGHRPRENGLCNVLGFNGELPDPLTGHYHLGNGYRQFNPVLMRFNSPDSWSPFGEGGLNAYVYCLGDPVNRVELNGHSSSLLMSLWKGFRNRIGVRTPSKHETPTSTIKSSLSARQSSKIPQPNALKEAKSFELNSLSQAELDLNYKPTSNVNFHNSAQAKELKYPIHIKKITDPKEKLANLKSAKINILNRLASDPPTARERRQLLLDNVNSDIDKLVNQVTQARSPHPTISI